jgi:predicted nucleic acid-binding protein
MTAILDTSFLVATVNRKDKNHDRVLETIAHLKESLILPTTVLPEVAYLISSRLGHHKMRQFLAEVVRNNVPIEHLEQNDLPRVIQILTEYADSELDFVDATIVAIAERMKVTKILTLDRRDFGMIRPQQLILRYYLNF